ncbi:MAG: 6-carboxytetrahydropterin synthase [Chloroflexi bacterium]|nr:6-carboxytetrahydropterin synthase [Chloroflexota bacterium]
MYTLAVLRDFIAQHYLVGGDWGPENQPHSHHYRLELRLEGSQLDEHGYLVDIVAVNAALDALLSRYRDHMLNDLPEFDGLNPSLEHFARILAHRLAERLRAANLHALEVRLWEDETAWAGYRLPLT